MRPQVIERERGCVEAVYGTQRMAVVLVGPSWESKFREFRETMTTVPAKRLTSRLRLNVPCEVPAREVQGVKHLGDRWEQVAAILGGFDCIH